MQFFKAFNWLCLFVTSVLAQSSEGITTDVSALSALATTTIAARLTLPSDKPDFFSKWARSTQVEVSTSKYPKYRRPTSSSKPTATLKGKYTRSIESPSRPTKLPRYEEALVVQAATRSRTDLPTRTLRSDQNEDASDIPGMF